MKTIALVPPRTIRHAFGAWCSGLLMACGGGGDGAATSAPPGPQTASPISNTATSSPAGTGTAACPSIGVVDNTLAASEVTGVVGGEIVYASERDWVILVTRADGTTLAFYGKDETTISDLAGYMYTAGPWWTGSDPTVYNGRDWGRGGEAVCLKAMISTGTPSLAGSLALRNGVGATLEGGAIPRSSYAFDDAALVAKVAGTYTLAGGGSLKVSGDGSLAGAYGGCDFTGTLQRGALGKNAFGITLQFASSCSALPSWRGSQAGFAIPYTPADGVGRLLLFTETNDGIDFYVTDVIAKK